MQNSLHKVFTDKELNDVIQLTPKLRTYILLKMSTAQKNIY